MKVSRASQAVAGLAIAVAVTLTLLCGGILAQAETRSAVSQPPSPTVFYIPTLTPPAQSMLPISPTVETTMVVIPTQVPTLISSATEVATLTQAPNATSNRHACQAISGWRTYRVQPGDTLFLIGLQYGLTVTTLMDANCLDSSTIYVGDVLYIPPVTPRPLPANLDGPEALTAPPPTGTLTATDGACTNPFSVISFPKVGAVLRGKVAISGTAWIENFDFYKIDIRQEGTDLPYANLRMGYTTVMKGTLADLDTTLFPNGEYWLRLMVVDKNANYPEPCAILVTLIN